MAIATFTTPSARHTRAVINLYVHQADKANDLDGNRWQREGSGWRCVSSEIGALGQFRTADQVRERAGTVTFQPHHYD